MTDETTPQDDAAMSPASAGSVADIIDRLCAAVQEDEPPRRALLVSAAAEIERLRFAIRRIAEQDATLSVCEGNVTVTVDGTLTDAEREALSWARNAMLVGVAVLPDDQTHNSKQHAATLGALLERTK